MLFKRNNKIYLRQKFRNFFIPIKGVNRNFKYILKRIWRINATPHSIAFGVSIGAFTSCTPFLGLHLIISIIISYIFRANLFATILGTIIGNPITFPFIWYIIYKIGIFILNEKYNNNNNELNFIKYIFNKEWINIWVILKPMLIGSIPFGLIIGGITYILIYRSIVIYQKIKINKIK